MSKQRIDEMRYLLSIGLFFKLIPALAVQYFAPDLDEVRWKVQGNRLMCTLSYHVPNFGDVRVDHVHAETPRALISSWQVIPNQALATLYHMDPNWKRESDAYRITQAHWQQQDGRSVLSLATQDTMKIISYLHVGKSVRIKYQDYARLDARVDLLPVNFLNAYDRFVQCAHDLIRFKFKEVADTTLYFGVDGTALSSSALVALKKIADYAIADKKVIKIKINGYSDNDGGRAHNIYLSELRAKRVAEYLQNLGVAKHKIKLNWHGSRYPAVVDDTPKGRALNRRVMVQLIR